MEEGRMSRQEVTPLTLGRTVLGPIVAEFCLRLWNLASQFERADDAALLFCARGGLRMRLAYERFLAAAGAESPLPHHSLMVSRAAAIRPSIARSISDGTALGPAAAAAVYYEFSKQSLATAMAALSGVEVDSDDPFWSGATTPEQLVIALARPDAQVAAREIVRQGELFAQHLAQVLGGRTNAVLVDTGLYGTTGQLLAEGFPELRVSTALMARSYRPLLGAPESPAFGLSVQARAYMPVRSRTALLRYWHFVEWLFEPELASVKRFDVVDGSVRSNLEVPGWEDRITSGTASVYDGVIDYLDGLPRPVAQTVLVDAQRAWSDYRRAVVWPTAAEGHALTVGLRTHDFGRAGTWGARPWRGPIAALRGSTMWREGEIARSGTPFRIPLLAAIEVAYAARLAASAARRAE
jgi:hypothetical protein